MIIDGKKIAVEIVVGLKARSVPQKTLVAVLVGDDESSVRFVRKKSELAAQLGIKFETRHYASASTTTDLVREVKKISDMPEVGGIIVQLPLPGGAARQEVLDAIAPDKDVDCLTSFNVARFKAGDFSLLSPTVGALRSVLASVGVVEFKDMKTAVVGAGVLVGEPVAYWFRAKGALVGVIKSDTADDERARILGKADIVVSGVGKSRLIKGGDIKLGAIVIDFGYPADVEVESVAKVASYYTPTPGGTGPIVVAELFRNFYKLNVAPRLVDLLGE